MAADKWLELLLLFKYLSLEKFISVESNFHFLDKIDYDKNERDERERDRASV